MNKLTTGTIQKTSKNTFLYLCKDVVKSLDFKKGEKVVITYDDKQIIIKKMEGFKNEY